MGYKEEQEQKLQALVTRFKKVALIGGAGLLALVLVFGSYGKVGPGERGVMVTMGKTGAEVLGEGPHLKLPFVSEIRTMSVKIHKSQDRTEAATKDIQTVTAVIAVNWTVNPDSVGRMMREVGDETSIENNIIAPAVSEVLKAATAKMTAEEVLTRRIELKTSIDESLISRLTTYGLVIKDISLVDLSFTHDFNKAVEDKQIAEQEAKQAEYVAQKAIQSAKAQVNSAKGQADSNLLVAEAEAKAQLIKARAQAEGQKLLKENLTKDVLALEYLKKWDGQLPSVLTGTGGGVMLQLPAQGSVSKGKNGPKESKETEESANSESN